MPLLQKRATTYRSIAGKALKQGQTLVDFSVASDPLIRLQAEPGMSYSLTDPVTGKVIEPKKVQQLQRALEIILPDGRQVVLDDFFTTVLNAEGAPLIQAQSEFVFFTGPGATPYWVVDPLANLVEWTLETGTQIWPSQDLLGVPQWMSTQGLSASALIVPSSIAVGSSGLGGLGSVLGALGGLGLAGGGGGGGSAPPASSSPVFTSPGATNVDEGKAISFVVYQAVLAADASARAPVFSLDSGLDAQKFNINSSTGALTFKAVPDAEKPLDVGLDNVYNVTIIATYDRVQFSQKAVQITVNDLADSPPEMAIRNVASVTENTPAGTSFFQVSAKSDVAGQALTYTTGGVDGALFNVNSSGQVSFKVSPNHEERSDYVLSVIATDPSGNRSVQQLVVTVIDVADSPPVFQGGGTANVSVSENGVLTSVAYAPTVAPDVVGSSLAYALTGVDAALFNVDAKGHIRFNSRPDFEAPLDSGRDNVYDLTLTATETSGLAASQVVHITVTNVTDTLLFTSAQSVSLAENISKVQTVTALIDSPTAGIKYTLSGGVDAAKFSLDANTGVLSFINAPDFENPSDSGLDNVYNVNVTATTTGLANNSSLSQSVSVQVVDAVATPPAILSSALSGVSNLDVRSDLVLTFNTAVQLSTNSAIKIRVVRDGGAGFHESSAFAAHARDTVIDITSGQLQLSADGKSLSINPAGDLDFGGSYHIEVDAGAFLSRSDPTGTAVSAANNNAATFSTVLPANTVNGSSSQKMTAVGGVSASQTYIDIQGMGSYDTIDARLNLSSGGFTLTYKDSLAAGGDANSTGIGTGTQGFNLQVGGFGSDDFLYFDDQTTVNAASPNRIDAFGGLLGPVLDNTPTGGAVQNFTGTLQIDPGGSGMPHAWIGFGLADRTYDLNSKLNQTVLTG